MLREFKTAHLYKQNVSCRVTPLPETELRPVSFNKLQQNGEVFFQKNSWRAHVSPRGNIVSSVRFCFQDANYAYATRRGILTKIRACEQLEQRPSFASTFKLDGTIQYPSQWHFNMTQKLHVRKLTKQY